MEIKAIETVYNGYRFRSRLEARWAVFYDTIGVAYEYEKEGYDLGEHGCYLPDFWLVDQECWVEIKGDSPSHGDYAKAESLAEMTDRPVYIFYGEIPLPSTPYGHDSNDSDSAHAVFKDGADYYYHWCICDICGTVGIEFDARSERINCGCPGEKDGRHKEYTANHKKLIQAYTAARQARFEHGETPRVKAVTS